MRRSTRREFVQASLAPFAAAAGRSAIGPPPARLSAQPRTQVIVVGAGLAGLTAAYELHKLGHDVTVLEARHRPGGRVHTLREPFADGLYAEAGGQAFFPVIPNYAAQYAEEFGLSPEPASRGGLSPGFVFGGKRFVPRLGEPIEWPLRLTSEEHALGLDGIRQKYVAPLLDQLSPLIGPDGWSAEAVQRFDALSFGDALRQRGASPAAVELLRSADFDYIGEGAGHYSSVDMLGQLFNVRAANRSLKGSFLSIAGGNDLLPRGFARRLGGRVHYGAAALRIAHERHRVTVEYRRAGERREISGDYLVCAIPFSVLRSLAVSPPFSPPKTRAIKNLAYASIARTYIQCRERFWYDQGLSGFMTTDLPTTYFWESTGGQPGPRGIVQGYVMGPHARRFGASGPEARESHALADAKRVLPDLSSLAETVTSIAWDAEPWSRGAYAWLRPGDAQRLWPHLATPEGRVHFAGEHTSTWFLHGSMQGALESGIRAAKAISGA